MGDLMIGTFLLLASALTFADYFEARNALACRTVETNAAAAASAALPRLPPLTRRLPCPRCEGARRLVLTEPDHGQNDGRIGVKKPKTRQIDCPVCGGKGRLASYGALDELYATIRQAREDFEARHLAQGDIAAGEAYVPRSLAGKLSRKDLRRVAQAYGKPCSRCRWSGVVACKTCKGKGLGRCPNKACEDGWVVEEIRTSGRARQLHVTPCPACKGANAIRCTACRGTRAQICNACQGAGTK